MNKIRNAVHRNYNVLNSNEKELFNTLNSHCCQEQWRILLRLSKIRFMSSHYSTDTICNNRGLLVDTQPVTEDVMSDFWSLWKKGNFNSDCFLIALTMSSNNIRLERQYHRKHIPIFYIPFSKYLLKDNIVEKNILENIQKMASFHIYFIIMIQFSWCLLFYSY